MEKFKDISGKKFGLLTVIERVESTKSGNAQWLCRCDCGNMFVVTGKSLRDGNTKSCGCILKKKRKVVDVGSIFGKLTVIDRAEASRTGKKQWLCRCECGKEKVFQEYKLMRGKKSCGCDQEKKKEVNVGDRFGKLTVTEKLEREKGKRQKWLCVCDCGNTTEVKDYDLRDGTTTSCGCNRKKKRESKDIAVGMRFGKLTVVEQKENDKNGKSRWLCRCECGNEKVVSGRNLRIGFVTSCGCDGIKIREIKPGDCFGYLKVLERVDNNKRGKSVWKCECKCGKIKDILGSALRYGSIRSCGCLIKDNVFERTAKEIPLGTRYGNLTVTEQSHIDSRGMPYYKCLCDCGKVAVYSSSQLILKLVCSCGCMASKEKNRKPIKPGTRFGRLVVVKFLGSRIIDQGWRNQFYLCKCDCGNMIEVSRTLLGGIKSCGCSFDSEEEVQKKELSFEYRKGAYIRIRRVFFDKKILRINLSDIFYKDFAKEKGIPLFLLTSLKDTVNSFMDIFEKYIDHIVDIFLVFFKSNTETRINVMFEQGFSISKDEFKLPKFGKRLRSYFLTDEDRGVIYGNFFYMCNIISIPIYLEKYIINRSDIEFCERKKNSIK